MAVSIFFPNNLKMIKTHQLNHQNDLNFNYIKEYWLYLSIKSGTSRKNIHAHYELWNKHILESNIKKYKSLMAENMFNASFKSSFCLVCLQGLI